MKIVEKKISKVLNNTLLNDIKLDSGMIFKGHVINEADVLKLQLMNIEKLFVAEAEDGDIDLNTVQGLIANKICGKNTSYVISSSGVVKIISMIDGLYKFDEQRLKCFNALDRNILLNTSKGYRKVKKGEVVAKFEFELPFYKEEKIEDIIFKLSGNVEIISIEEVSLKRAALIYVEFYKNKSEKKYFSDVAAKLMSSTLDYDLDFYKIYNIGYEKINIINAIDSAVDSGCEIVFIISSIKNSGKDIIFDAISPAVDVFLVKDIAKVGLNDFFIAKTTLGAKIIALPHYYNIFDTKDIDSLIATSILESKPTFEQFRTVTSDLVYKTPKGYEVDESNVVVVNDYLEQNKRIAIIILAAGSSKRICGNKLLVKYHDEDSMIVSVIKSAISSQTGPVYVVTGHDDEEIKQEISDYDVNIIYNNSHQKGVKGSIRLGLNFVPDFCKAAILLPADMPNISKEHLRNLADSYDNRKSRQVIFTSFENKIYNPVLWSRNLFPHADMVPENIENRKVFLEFSDLKSNVEAKSIEEVKDINYMSDLK